MEIVWLPLSEIYPREFYNGDFVDSEEALDYIAEKLVTGGKLEPITVCPREMLRPSDRWNCACQSDMKRSKKQFLLNNGHHRFKIAKLLGLSLVPCVFREGFT